MAIYSKSSVRHIKMNADDNSCLLWGKHILISELLFHSQEHDVFNAENLKEFLQKSYSYIDIDKLKKYAVIREINGRIEIPRAISYTLRKKGPIDPLNKEETDFLHFLNEKIGYTNDRKLIISRQLFEEILTKHRSYFTKTPDTKTLYNRLGLTENVDEISLQTLNKIEISVLFRSQTIARLWELLLLRKCDKTDEDNFNELLSKCYPISQNPCPLMPSESQERFLKCANTLLATKDLRASENEFLKLYLDLDPYTNVSLSNGLKMQENFKISTKSCHDLYLSLNCINYHLYGNMTFSGCRQYVRSIVRIIMDNDNSEYENTIKLFSNAKEYPYVFYSIIELLKSEYSGVIPFLLEHIEFDYIALDLSTKINIDKNIIGYKTNPTVSCEQRRTEFLIDELKILRSRSQKADQCKYFADIFHKLLYATAAKIFSNEPAIEEYKKRFEPILSYATNPSFFNFDTSFEEYYNILISNITQTEPSRTRAGASYHINLPTYYILGKFISLPQHSEGQKKCISETFIKLLQKELSQTEITVRDLDTGAYKTTDIYWNDDLCGIELIDWDKLFLEAQKFDMLPSFSDFSKVKYKCESKNEQEYQQIYLYNSNQTKKLRILIQILALTYKKINGDKSLYINKDLKCNSLLNNIEDAIVKIISKDTDSSFENKKRVQLSDGILHMDLKVNRHHNPYIIQILGDVCNYFSDESIKSLTNVITKYPDGLGLLLILFNAIGSESAKRYIQDKANSMDASSLIDNIYWMPTLEYFLISACNSDNFPEIANVLFEKYKSIAKNRESNQNMLKYIELFMAYKKSSIEEIIRIKEPSNTEINYTHSQHAAFNDKKKFYIKMIEFERMEKDNNYTIDNLLDFERTLADLCKKHNNNTIYFINKILISFKLAEKLEASCEDKKNKNAHQKLVDILDEIRNFEKTIIKIANQEEVIDLIKIKIISKLNKQEEFWTEYTKLPILEQINEDFLPVAIDFLVKWRDYSKASTLLETTTNFYCKRKITCPRFLNGLKDKLGNDENLGRLANALRDSLSLSFAKFTKIVPERINEFGYEDYRHFIAYEIAIAAKTMLEKIKSVKGLNHENMYTDILESLLNSRITAYGRDGFTSQNRSGTSATGKDAGSVDLKMTCELNNLIIESIRWHNSNFKGDLQSHISKIFNYDPARCAFYDVIYLQKTKIHLSFDEACKKFKEEIFPTLKFPSEYEMEFTEDLSSKFSVNTVNILLSKHKNNLYFYHILIDIEYAKS